MMKWKLITDNKAHPQMGEERFWTSTSNLGTEVWAITTCAFS